MTFVRTKPEVKHGRAAMGKMLATEPLERVAVDVLGPLPTIERGNRFIIVVGDYFPSGWRPTLVKNTKQKQ